jgi:SAM-dependent methyltransferase
VTLDERTAAFYAHWAAHGQEAGRSAISRHFDAAFAPGARVLDVGCGMGRDLAVLLDSGFDAYGVEPNGAMRARAIERHPELADRIATASLPAMVQPFGASFDAIVCSAVLMHLSAADLVAAFHTFNSLIAPGGRLLLSVPEIQHDSLADGRDADGRQFTNHAPERVQSLLADLGFASLGRWEMATPDTNWTVLLFER